MTSCQLTATNLTEWCLCCSYFGYFENHTSHGATDQRIQEYYNHFHRYLLHSGGEQIFFSVKSGVSLHDKIWCVNTGFPPLRCLSNPFLSPLTLPFLRPSNSYARQEKDKHKVAKFSAINSISKEKSTILHIAIISHITHLHYFHQDQREEVQKWVCQKIFLSTNGHLKKWGNQGSDWETCRWETCFYEKLISKKQEHTVPKRRRTNVHFLLFSTSALVLWHNPPKPCLLEIYSTDDAVF